MPAFKTDHGFTPTISIIGALYQFLAPVCDRTSITDRIIGESISGIYLYDKCLYVGTKTFGNQKSNEHKVFRKCEEKNHDIWWNSLDVFTILNYDGKYISAPAELKPDPDVSSILIFNGSLYIGTTEYGVFKALPSEQSKNNEQEEL